MAKLMKLFLLLGLVSVLSTGCEGAYRAFHIPGANVENRETIVLLTKTLQDQIAVEGQQAIWNEANLLEVNARLRNRTEKTIRVEVQTVFKDQKGYSINDVSVWQRLIFEPNETKIYHVNSMTSNARRFTVRVREVR
jgi:uncharacterized protein YcfL